jgi:hypothetical protein
MKKRDCSTQFQNVSTSGIGCRSSYSISFTFLQCFRERIGLQNLIAVHECTESRENGSGSNEIRIFRGSAAIAGQTDLHFPSPSFSGGRLFLSSCNSCLYPFLKRRSAEGAFESGLRLARRVVERGDSSAKFRPICRAFPPPRSS